MHRSKSTTADMLPRTRRSDSAAVGFVEYGFCPFARAAKRTCGRLAGNATQTILLDAGTLLHQLEGAKDTYQAAASTYRGTVIGAVQNVVDTLRALQTDADALRAARDFERAAKGELDLAGQQMQSGNANVLLLLDRGTNHLQAVIQVVQARGKRLLPTRQRLFQALGGGWWNLASNHPAGKVLDVGTGEVGTLTDSTTAIDASAALSVVKIKCKQWQTQTGPRSRL